MDAAYPPVPIWLPRRRRIVTPAEWLRDRLAERERTVARAIAFDANLGTVTNSASLTTSAAAASNSRVFMFVWWNRSGGTCTGASGGGLTWVVDHQDEWVGTNNHLAILSADAQSGLASSTVLTPSFTAIDFGPGIAAGSFTGIATGATGYVDTTSTAVEDFNETWATNNLVTTLADTLLIGLSASSSATAHAATAPATELHEWVVEGANDGASVYRIVSAAGTYTLGGVWTGTVDYQHNIGVAYKAAAEAEAATPTGGRRFPLFSGRR